ncbi:phage antirepressor KilAC domain-containing protein [Rhizobium leguminosarum]|uniref:phage antirepressor KilAC domain-containing protein n=1 Tax=Rhizobium leguminosarum TaxID=384 RepID=UPI001C963E84|nr:phage antirepressor KilAC domain-containing protein [Rhizobium leguminosarum]
MVSKQEHASASDAIGIGSYTAPEAARLLKTSPVNVNRWLRGYAYRRSGEQRHMPPLWTSQHAEVQDHLEIGFRDLIELRFVKAFIYAGVGLLAIRNCLEYARVCAKDERPFSTRRFQTDGRTIFLESIERAAEPKLLDLKKRQYVFKQAIEGTFKDLDIEDEAVARWRPFHGKQSIVIDPGRAFGQPIASQFGVPTVALAEAVEAEGSVEDVARLFDVPVGVVRDAVQFEAGLKRAA